MNQLTVLKAIAQVCKHSSLMVQAFLMQLWLDYPIKGIKFYHEAEQHANGNFYWRFFVDKVVFDNEDDRLHLLTRLDPDEIFHREFPDWHDILFGDEEIPNLFAIAQDPEQMFIRPENPETIAKGILKALSLEIRQKGKQFVILIDEYNIVKQFDCLYDAVKFYLDVYPTGVYCDDSPVRNKLKLTLETDYPDLYEDNQPSTPKIFECRDFIVINVDGEEKTTIVLGGILNEEEKLCTDTHGEISYAQIVRFATPDDVAKLRSSQ